MKFQVDFATSRLTVEGPEGVRDLDLGSPESFEILSRAWLRAGWDTKYVYGFSWLGRPIIQLPEDMFRIQEVIYALRPDVIVETGVAHGGSLIFYAGIFEAIGHGRVIGVDIEIRPHNREAIEAHRLARRIQLVEGSSIHPGIVAEVQSLIQPGEKVMVVLDACHTRGHVLAELRAYSHLVTKNSYIVAADGIMKDLQGAPRSGPDWALNNPYMAVQDFLAEAPQFAVEPPLPPFNEGNIRTAVTYWPGAWVKRIKDGS